MKYGFNVILGQLFMLLEIGVIVLIYLKKRPKKKAEEVEDPPAPGPVPEEEYWEGNWSYIGGKYKEIKLAKYRAVYCYDYYPKNRYGAKLSKQDYAHQQEILSFKSGEYYRAAELVSDFIVGHLWKSSLKGWMLCVIPASTQDATEKRFKVFCAEVAKNTGMIDGYSLIWRKEDQRSSRMSGKQEDTLEGIEINASAFMGKNVLLVDDITTRGRSFRQLADNLVSAGANRVVGFFMGKSVY